MIATLLLMLVGGIGLTQAASDPHQVTLRWLRLGGIIALSLMGVAAIVNTMTDAWPSQAVLQRTLFAATAAAAVVQIITVQLAQRKTQQLAAALTFSLATAAITLALLAQLNDAAISAEQSSVVTLIVPRASPAYAAAAASLMAATSAGLLGGFLMTMLLGHAYLTAGDEMGQAPFRRLVILMGVLLAARLVIGVIFGLVPYMQLADVPAGSRIWNTVMISARYAVGLAVPAVFTWMTHECVQRRANQSATGILYVAGVLIILGEGISLALVGALGGVF